MPKIILKEILPIQLTVSGAAGFMVAGSVSLTAFVFLLIYSPVKSIQKNINEYKNIYTASLELKDKYHFGGNIVSLTDTACATGITATATWFLTIPVPAITEWQASIMPASWKNIK